MIPWSFTVLSAHRTCARQYHEVRVLKRFVEEKSDESIWGDRVHKAIALALTDNVPLPTGMDVWQGIVEQFRTFKGVLSVENQMAITEGFTPCGWWDKQTWCRAILDAVWIDGDVAKIVDWKTGKQKPGSDQLALFALVIFAYYPQVQTARTMFVWLKNGGKTREDYTRADIPRLWQLFLPDVKRLENAHANQVWTPRTSGLCHNHCPVVTCEFNGRRRNWT